MGDSAMVIVAIFLAAILMFVFPLMTMANKKDDVSVLEAQKATTEFVDKIKTTGIITQSDYDNFTTALAATENTFDINIEVQKLDENPAKKETSIYTTIGDNVYYTIYTTQILDTIKDSNLALNEGDIVSVSVENTNVTIGQELRNFLYRVTGNKSGTVTASDSGIVTTNGSAN